MPKCKRRIVEPLSGQPRLRRRNDIGIRSMTPRKERDGGTKFVVGPQRQQSKASKRYVDDVSRKAWDTWHENVNEKGEGSGLQKSQAGGSLPGGKPL